MSINISIFSQIPNRSRHLIATISIITIFFIAACTLVFSSESIYILLPTIVTVFIFVIFSIILSHRIRGGLFGELGFLYLGLAVGYTVIPAIIFLVADFTPVFGWVWEMLFRLLPTPRELGIHLWRHVLFVFGIALGYLLVRQRLAPSLGKQENEFQSNPQDGIIVMALIVMFFCCAITVSLLSAPVVLYWDHYTRYDHLSWIMKRIAYTCLMLKSGGCFVLFTFLFKNYNKYKFLIFSLTPIICLFELLFSHGARIETLTLLLGVVYLYHHFVRPITFKLGLMFFVAIAAIFTLIEVFRASDFNLFVTKEIASSGGVMPASEFGAVFFPGFHLYADRAQGALPPTEWPMFFNDFIQLVPFADHTRWNPQFWYARYYFPESVVPPETLGIISDSAIWGGELDLFIRSLINGAFFAYIVRWCLTHSKKWWALVIYVYCYSTCVMTIKYSLFYQFTSLKTLVPALLFVEILRRILQIHRKQTRSEPV